MKRKKQRFIDTEDWIVALSVSLEFHKVFSQGTLIRTITFLKL